MRIRHALNNRGFTLAEVVVAATVFSITAMGIFSSLTALRGPAEQSDQKLVAAHVAKGVLDELRAAVDATTYYTSGNPLDPTGATVDRGTVTIDGTQYSVTYTCIDDPGGTNTRRVDVTVTW